MHWAANISDGEGGNAFDQTTSILKNYVSALSAARLTLGRNTIRTWLYVDNIESHYGGMVDARRHFFARHGLTGMTRYVASTGIGGRGPVPGAAVSLDALAFGGISQRQIVVMEAVDHMPRAITYGVTFERGLRVRFGDRSHLYVSGTASINEQGRELHEGDIEKQTQRALENVQALLAGQGADWEDLVYVCLYLRNTSDLARALPIVHTVLPADVPLIAVQGVMCRPQLLIEMEAEAITADRTSFPVFL